MDRWEIFNETSIPDKEAFYSKLNKEGISNVDYAHAQKVWKAFEIKNLGEYHDLYLHYCFQMCSKTLEINLLRFMNLIPLISSRSSMASLLKKDWGKIKIINRS